MIDREHRERIFILWAIIIIILFCVGLTKLLTGCGTNIPGSCAYDELTGISVSYSINNETCISRNNMNHYEKYDCYSGWINIAQTNHSSNLSCSIKIIDKSTDYSKTVYILQQTYVPGNTYNLYKELRSDECYVANGQFQENTYVGISLLCIVALNIIGFVFELYMVYRVEPMFETSIIIPSQEYPIGKIV